MDYPVTIQSTSSGASGANLLMRWVKEQVVVPAVRNWGSPLKYVTNVSDAVAERGNIVGVTVAPNVLASDLVDGQATINDDTPGSTVNVTLSQQKISKFSITSVDAALAGGVQFAMKQQAAVNAVLNAVEEDVMATGLAGSTSNTYVGSANTAITEAVIVSAVQTILDQRPPANEPLIAQIRSGTTSWGALMQLSNFVQAYTIASGNAVGATGPAHESSYGQGKLWHFAQWYLSHAVPKVSTTTSNLLWHPKALAVAMRVPVAPVTGAIAETVMDAEKGIVLQIIQQWDGARLANEFIVRALYGAAVVKPEWLIEVRS